MSWLESFLSTLVPHGMQYLNPNDFEDDERRWFQAGVENDHFRFGECIGSCPRFKRWKLTGKDEFLTPAGEARHLLNFQDNLKSCYIGREYIPHIAAVSRLLNQMKYDRSRYSFSRYRSFTQDLILKKLGSPFETDAEFYDSENKIYLHVEAKKSRREVEAIASQIDSVIELGSMPEKHRKEIEYVLDLVPRYLWLVGPGLIEPERFVYEVQVDGLRATFQRIECLPSPPN
jgi:hypothetical protein